MASTILSKMKNKNNPSTITGPNNNGDMLSQFSAFKKQIESSGQNPQALLNQMLASGNVSPQMLNKAKTLAMVFANKFKMG
ncbi:MAG: hypothetical protein J6S85_12785 [Methanobrevibacter sp.]|nr:hypothetical protein [Methanobrevibacter sp.]